MSYCNCCGVEQAEYLTYGHDPECMHYTCNHGMPDARCGAKADGHIFHSDGSKEPACMEHMAKHPAWLCFAIRTNE